MLKEDDSERTIISVEEVAKSVQNTAAIRKKETGVQQETGAKALLAKLDDDEKLILEELNN